jgi:leucyl aminopeptidase
VKISVQKGKLAETKSQAIILALFEDSKKLAGVALQIDQKTAGLISELIANHDFEAKPSQISVIYTRGLLPAKRIALVGLGKYSEFNLEKLRIALAKAMQHLRSINIKEAAAYIDLNLIPDAKDKVAQAVAEGALLGFINTRLSKLLTAKI